MHPIRVLCLVIGAVFLYVAGHLHLYGKAASQRFAPQFVAAELNWHKTIDGKLYALTQYPEGASDPGPWAMRCIAPSAHSIFSEETTPESGKAGERQPRADGASRRVTSLVIAGNAFELPLRLEWILLGTGLVFLAIPRFVLRGNPNRAGQESPEGAPTHPPK